MTSLESEVKLYLKKNNYDYEDNCNSKTKNDFKLSDIEFDVKEKRQKYKNHWTKIVPEEHLFIIDDVAARKIFLAGPKSAILIKDQIRNCYFVTTALTLFMMPKQRINRRVLVNGNMINRGKWLIDFRNVKRFDLLELAINYLLKYRDECENGKFIKSQECYEQFIGELLPIKGTVRSHKQQVYDYGVTR